jgi:hypothetical protein
MVLGGHEMSYQAADWVLHNIALSGTDKLVLVAMAFFADIDGTRVFAGRQRLAFMACVTERSITASLKKLTKGGYIKQYRDHVEGRLMYRVILGGADGLNFEFDKNQLPISLGRVVNTRRGEVKKRAKSSPVAGAKAGQKTPKSHGETSLN